MTLVLGLRPMFKSIAKHFDSENKRLEQSSIVNFMSLMIWTRFKGTCMQERKENKWKPLEIKRRLKETWNQINLSQMQMHSLYTRREIMKANSEPHLWIKEIKANGIKIIQRERHLGGLPLLQIKRWKMISMHNKRLIMRLSSFHLLINWTLVFDEIFKLATNVEVSRVANRLNL